jgi:hypothetical protein
MIQNNFLSIKNISGLSCLTNELEEELNIYLKLFVLALVTSAFFVLRKLPETEKIRPR